MLLAFAGGGLGILFAFWSLEGIRSLGTASVPRLGEIAINGQVLLFTMAVSMGSGVLFGLAPALRLSDVALGARDRGARGADAARICS